MTTPTILAEPLPPQPTVSFQLPKSISIDGGDETVTVYAVSGDTAPITLEMSNGDPDENRVSVHTKEEARALAYWLLMYADSVDVKE